MQNHFKILTLLAVIGLVTACTKYEFPKTGEPSPGLADFSKLIVVGNSLSSGYMNGTVYTSSQVTSFPNLIATQMKAVGGGAFNQPTMPAAAVNGCLNPSDGCTMGRLYLKMVNGSPIPTPKMPGNPETFAPYAGDRAALNSFSVPGLTIVTSLLPQTGGPASPSNPVFNPYYWRFASNPGTSTVIGDAAAAMAKGGTFFIYSLGANDVLGYATGGAADPSLLTSAAAFSSALNKGISALLKGNPNANGVIANIPDVNDLPFFNTVPFAPIPLTDPNQVTVLNSNFAGYNAILESLIANKTLFGISDALAAELAGRTISYQVTTNSTKTNKVMITDETLTDLEPYLTALVNAKQISAAQKAALQPFRKVRQTRATDKITLTTASVIGTVVANNPNFVNGVSVPLGWTPTSVPGSDVSDEFLLIPSELSQIQTRTAEFNSILASYAQSFSGDPIILVDLFNTFKSLNTGTYLFNGSPLTISMSPPFGAFALDGVHPNARGYGFLANVYISAINKRWKSEIPLVDINSLPGNELPVQ